MIEKFIKQVILKIFFMVELSSGERVTAEESIKNKYALALKRTIVYCVLSIFPILFLNTDIIISVLIPITMVAGTAWFSISLANMKEKFEKFGMELTINLFEAFAISLGLLFMLSIFSLSNIFWQEIISTLPYQIFFQLIAFIVGSVIIGNIIYKIFIGSMQYDINDAMLSGQNEAAEKFYRKSLSLLHSVANSLRDGKSTQVANYYIGVAFFEIFTRMKQADVVANEKLIKHIEKSNTLVKRPSMPQEEADKISFDLIQSWFMYCKNPQGLDSMKSLEAIKDELWALENNRGEVQEMVDTRLGIVFQEIASLLEGQGDSLFIEK